MIARRPRAGTPSPCDDAAVTNLAAAINVAPIVARSAVPARALRSGSARLASSTPALDHLHDPDVARRHAAWRVDRILARDRSASERIAIHGDYDVDGDHVHGDPAPRARSCSAPTSMHFIPERLRDGYGLQPAAIERLHADGVALVVSVDCGIRGADAAIRARELGVDLIITDHHEPGRGAAAGAARSSTRSGTTAPIRTRYLAGVGVALKLVQALCRAAGRDGWLPGFVKIAAIGTLADVVPLVGENRVIAKLGLDLLTRGPHKVGLRVAHRCLRASPARRSTAITSASCWRRASTRPDA